jgi:hypothetical protein
MKSHNSTLSVSKKPMKRSPLNRKSALKAGTKRLRSRGPKMTPIRASAKGEDCTINLPGCNYNPETVVLCHSNLLKDGKGMGLKAPDTRAAYGCCACHDVLDGRFPLPIGWTMEMVLERFELAIERTHARLRQKGLLA